MKNVISPKIMHFPPLPFDRMNEADVREEVLAPIIRALGYGTGTEHDVVREQSLRYPRLFLGRKNANKDLELRGRADYILESSGRVRWVLEAKAPQVAIEIDDIEQAWTYANHAEVRAVYFALSNGHEFQIFRTTDQPNRGSVLSIAYTDLPGRWADLANLLAPLSIARDFPNIVVDMSQSLGPGLRSFARITSGLIRYGQNSIRHPVLAQLQSAIADGSIERAEGGGLVVYLSTQSLLRSLQELNEKLGLNKFEMRSTSERLSVQPDEPDVFEYVATVTLPAGSKVLDMQTWSEIVLPVNVNCTVSATACGFLQGGRYGGTFAATYWFQQLPVPPLEVHGEFHVCVA
jgi:hypothetical protein